MTDLSDIDEACCSSMLKLLRITPWILNILKKRDPFSGSLTPKELQEIKAEMGFVHPVQRLP